MIFSSFFWDDCRKILKQHIDELFIFACTRQQTRVLGTQGVAGLFPARLNLFLRIYSMKKLLYLFAFLWSVNGRAQGYFFNNSLYYHSGFYNGYPISWGYVHYPNWPGNYWGNLAWNGYSFYPYFNYQPYYQTYAVISYSSATDTWGSSWGQVSREMAAVTANSYCGHDTCRPVVWVQGGCASLMTSASTKRVSWGIGSSTSAASMAARNACVMGGQASDCAVRAWVCSY